MYLHLAVLLTSLPFRFHLFYSDVCSSNAPEEATEDTEQTERSERSHAENVANLYLGIHLSTLLPRSSPSPKVSNFLMQHQNQMITLGIFYIPGTSLLGFLFNHFFAFLFSFFFELCRYPARERRAITNRYTDYVDPTRMRNLAQPSPPPPPLPLPLPLIVPYTSRRIRNRVRSPPPTLPAKSPQKRSDPPTKTTSPAKVAKLIPKKTKAELAKRTPEKVGNQIPRKITTTRAKNRATSKIGTTSKTKYVPIHLCLLIHY